MIGVERRIDGTGDQETSACRRGLRESGGQGWNGSAPQARSASIPRPRAANLPLPAA